MQYTQSDIDRFWSKINKKTDEECWNWTTCIGRTGYGMFSIGQATFKAHRVAWEITNGPIPEKRHILHKCDNKLCCNPSHLYCGTNADNATDKMSRGLDIYPGKSTLYEGEIWLIRHLCICIKNKGIRKKYKFSTQYIAKMFKVVPSTIHRIWHLEKYLCKEGYYV